ncbi:multiple monosaccharide ABC transporter permease [Burkholderia multivorans]|uniref:multiple monosaccharide ABC transporter permease n=1 Tax=Burkholderia multivorans TaxID=87883 RepID=UPI0009BED69F|nr:multiple monosaccharide ABC transporter permease [Burkholderia multivorans]MCO1340837.1 sugar ABC transporter permease [Burkholderia multivorans]MCO1439988.1 sugar ABC transporter permease [Burkholderia multivorans]MDR8751417.1 Xylose transport system permease protein XylH [Burkholderia multivorans]MDR8807417.1 Xylose transport system permease protein XylH [Burkholderia multivorans]PRF84815.1 sugar ABC transporter permease [Burkholderia multivorans]
MRKALSPTAPQEGEVKKSEIMAVIKRGVSEYGLLFSLVVIMVFFQVATSGVLMQPLNLTNLVLQNSYIVIMALGMLMVIVAGHIDLSVGSTAGLVGALAAVLMVQFNVNYVVATIICIATGALIGAVQGYWIAFWRMPSFIVTLAGMLVFRGLTNLVLQGQSIGPFPDAFAAVSSGFIPDVFRGEDLHITSIVLGILVGAAFFVIELRHRASAAKYGMGKGSMPMMVAKNAVLTGLIVYFCYLLASYRGLPTVLVIMGVLIAVYTFVMNRTTIGRRVYAVGGNAKAARLSGVSVPAVSFLTFVNMGVLAALAGIIFAARLNSGTPKAGTGFELDVIAACFIGGASASGGVGKVVGAVVGAFIMGVMNNGMSIMGIGVDYQQVIKGIVLLAAVFVDVYNKNKA